MAFDLKSIGRTRRIRAPKVVIAGANKIGKSTFAASSPAAIGILTEQGMDAIDSHAFPVATSLADVYAAIGTLIDEEHEFQTLFIDSLDWLEPLLHAHVCQANGWSDIEKPGYGKGYIAAADEWRNLLTGLDALREHRNMGVVLIAHDKIKRIEDPLTEGYDSHVLKLHDRASALVMEWADVIGYAGYRVFTTKTDAGFGQKETKANTTGERLLHVEAHPAHCGGNRFGLRNMPLDWNAFSVALTAAQTLQAPALAA
jgi:AAA domain